MYINGLYVTVLTSVNSMLKYGVKNIGTKLQRYKKLYNPLILFCFVFLPSQGLKREGGSPVETQGHLCTTLIGTSRYPTTPFLVG